MDRRISNVVCLYTIGFHRLFRWLNILVLTQKLMLWIQRNSLQRETLSSAERKNVKKKHRGIDIKQRAIYGVRRWIYTPIPHNGNPCRFYISKSKSAPCQSWCRDYCLIRNAPVYKEVQPNLSALIHKFLLTCVLWPCSTISLRWHCRGDTEWEM